MQEFNNFIQDWGLGILLLTIYARMRYGGDNIKKYERWDAYRKKQKLLLKSKNRLSRKR